ncbi:hypothetical protein [Streptomyces diastaticus]
MDTSLSFESFLSGAGQAAAKAMEDHGRGEYDEFALHGGVAVERLAKAALIKKNPVFLVEMRNGPSDMLLYFGGHLKMDPEKVRTVGANEALRRLRRMAVLPSDPQLDLLIELRNGTAHTTVGDQAKTLLPTLAETVVVLLADIGISVNQFWGRWATAVNVAVDKERNDIQRDVEIRIRQARHRFEDKLEGLPTGSKDHILGETAEKLEIVGVARGDDQLLALLSTIPCPSCKATARVKIVPMEAEEPGLTLRATALHCFVCQLDLHTPDEISAASVDIEDALLPTSVHTMRDTTPATGLRVEHLHRF